MNSVYRNKDGDLINKVDTDNNIVIVNDKVEDKVEKKSK